MYHEQCKQSTVLEQRSLYDRHVQTILFVMYIYTYMLVYFCGLKSLHNKYNYNVYTNLHTHARTHAHATHTHTHTYASSHIQTHKTHARTHTYAHTHTNAQNTHTFIFIKYDLCHYSVYVCIAFLVMDESVIFAFLLQ